MTLVREDFRTTSERHKDDGISVCEARGRVLREANCNVSFIVIIFNFKHSLCYVVSP